MEVLKRDWEGKRRETSGFGGAGRRNTEGGVCGGSEGSIGRGECERDGEWRGKGANRKDCDE